MNNTTTNEFWKFHVKGKHTPTRKDYPIFETEHESKNFNLQMRDLFDKCNPKLPFRSFYNPKDSELVKIEKEIQIKTWNLCRSAMKREFAEKMAEYIHEHTKVKSIVEVDKDIDVHGFEELESGLQFFRS